jgi:hypothetical protein
MGRENSNPEVSVGTACCQSHSMWVIKQERFARDLLDDHPIWFPV